MKIWLDAHISPAIAKFLNEDLSIEAHSLSRLGLRDYEDEDIFQKAKEENIIFVTKDNDFLDLLERLGSPPKVIWLRIGNTSNEQIRKIFRNSLDDILKLLEAGNNLVEVESL